MRATMIHGERDVRSEIVPDPAVLTPTDAVVRVTASCVCGSDLWRYRGVVDVPEPRPIGHEFVGIVEAVGAQVSTVRPGQFVMAPFMWSDNTCPNCRAGVQSACEHGGFYGGPDRDGLPVDGGQGEYVRVPLADGSLVAAPETPDDAMLPALLSVTDVMCTGWHAARSARVRPGDTVVVVGDGAVGLCGVLAASLQGAGRIIAMSRHEPRQHLARRFGATDVVAERGEDGVAAVRELTDGVGADAVLECVGTEQALLTAVDCARAGSTVGFVGLPHGVTLPLWTLAGRSVGLAGGLAPARAYLEELRDKVLAGECDPSPVFDRSFALADVATAYREMDERRSIKSLLAY